MKKNNLTIPQGWREERMGTFGLCVRGVSYAPKDLRQVVDDSSIELLRSNNIKDDKLNLSDIQIVSREKVSNNQILKQGDIFICMSNGSKSLVGKNVYIDNNPDYTIGAFCALFRPDSGKNVPSFVKQLFLSEGYIKQIQDSLAGTSINNLKNSHIEDLKFLFPTKPEQQKIAEILGAVDEDIAKTQEVIEVTEKLKRGLMQQLFTRGIGHTKFKETKIGEIPEEWEVVSLGSLGEVVTGNTPKTSDKNNYGNDFLWVSPKDIGNVKYIYDSESKLSNKGFDLTRKLPTGAVLVVCIGSTIGKIAIAGVNLSTNQQINSIVVNQDNSNEYIYYQLLYRRQDIIGRRSTQAIPIINKTDFSQTELAMPKKRVEQQEIAEILSAVDEKISVNKKLKEKLTLLKKGLMQDLLSGKVRVNI